MDTSQHTVTIPMKDYIEMKEKAERTESYFSNLSEHLRLMEALGYYIKMDITRTPSHFTNKSGGLKFDYFV